MKSSKLILQKGKHYGDYVDGSSNVSLKRIANEVYEFQIHETDEDEEIIKSYESFTITPHTDLTRSNSSW